MAVDITNSNKNQLYEQQILCKNNCGYYGNSIQWRGYCSICYRKLVINATNQAENTISILTVDNNNKKYDFN